jgi:large subunit ribosomal protein L5
VSDAEKSQEADKAATKAASKSKSAPKDGTRDGTPTGTHTKAKVGNPNRALRIEKVVVNIGVGEAGERMVKAASVLKMITGRTPVQTISKTTNKDLAIRKGMPIGMKVTLRRKAAEEFFKTAMWVRGNRIADYSFDQDGNCSFGVADYTDFPNQRYDPEIGIFGMSLSVTFTRPGKRVQNRRRAARRIPGLHRITPPEAKAFMREKYGIEVVE